MTKPILRWCGLNTVSPSVSIKLLAGSLTLMKYEWPSGSRGRCPAMLLWCITGSTQGHSAVWTAPASHTEHIMLCCWTAHHLTLNTLCYAMLHTYCKHTYTPTHTHLRRFTLFFSSNWLQPTSQGRPKASQSTTSLTPLHTESTQGQPYNMIACHNLTKPSIQHTITYSALLTTGVYC